MESILAEHEGPLTRITLNRPDRRNALSAELMTDLITALESIPQTTSVVVIGANGPVFSAGHDLRELVGGESEFVGTLFETCTHLMETVHRIPQPVIAKVHGVATAAGCQLVASCDLAVATDDAMFATPGVKIGLFCSTPMVPISRAVGRKRAMQMLLTGEPISASTAVEWGLINEAVPAADLDDAVDRLVGQITRFSGEVIGIGKEAFYAQVDLEEHEAYMLTRKVMTSNASHPDAQEGMSAFLEKRVPEWRR